MRTLSPFREDLELASTETQYADETWYAPEIVGSAPPVAEQEASEWEEEAFDFGEAEAEAGHPILALFPLPPAVLEALSNGLGSVAVGLAANAGYRDVNQLTNIVFYFRHPNLIGRKIRPEERDLAAEWVSIRDRLVKPALRSTVSGLPPLPSVARPGTFPDVLSPERLQWPGHSAEELEFMRAVYRKHRENAQGDFVMDLPDGALGRVDGHWARKDTAAAARIMLEAARKELEKEHPGAEFGIVSAYRSATEQFRIWQGRDPKGKDEGSGFPHYYGEAIRLGLVDKGDFSPAAVAKVAQHLGGFIASPGFSNHQDGLAIDFGVGLKGKRLGKLKRDSPFHRWLKDHAAEHHFVPLKKEAWHWTYHPPAASKEVWAGEAELEVAAPVRAGEVRVPRIPLLARHRGSPPDLILRWNDMPSVPEEIDVAVHLHGFWYDRMSLVRDIDPVSGLDLVPVKGESGQGRTRPTLTVLPRGNNTGVKQTHGPYNAYTFPALVTKTGLTDLLRVALDRFAAEVGGSAPRVGRLILTAHSGGGKALLQILQYHDPHQVHVFDALYWPPQPLVAWARKRIARDRAAGAGTDYMAREGGGLRVFYQGRYQGGTRPNSLAVRKALTADIDPSVAPWYRVEASKYDHFQIPRLYGWRVLGDVAADVPQAYVEQTRPRREAELEWEDEDENREDFAALDEAEEQEEDEEDEDLFGEGELWEAEDEDEDEGIESPEVERGEAVAFLGELDEEELPFEREEETPASVAFPSGLALRVISGPTREGEEHYDPNRTGNPLLDTGASVRGQRVSANFTVGELVKSGGTTFDRARVDPELVRCLQKLRDRVGKPVRVTSGYRPYLYNADLYTKKYGKTPTVSRHSSGQAADVNVASMTGMQIAKVAIDACGTEIGVGVGDGYAHVDVRGKWARWTYFESDKQRNDQAIAELDAYRRQRLGGAPPAPAPTPAPAVGAVRFRRVKKGWAAYGGGRLEDALRRAARSGAITISDRDIDTLQRIADTESSGLANALNSWDNAVMSIAFKQWTLRWGELQDLIARAPEAFARHGIRLAPPGTNYTFSSKGKVWTQRAIDGVPDKETLRSENWGRRFFAAALEPEAIAAAATKALEDIRKLEQTVRTKIGWSPHLESSRGRALLAELDNNRPAYVKGALTRTLARAKEQPGIGEEAFLELFVAEIVRAYEANEHDAEKGRRWTSKIMRR